MRVTNSGQLVLTFEWDVEDPKFLDQQIRWTIAGSDKKSSRRRVVSVINQGLRMKEGEQIDTEAGIEGGAAAFSSQA